MQFHDVSIGFIALCGVLGLIWLIQRMVRAGGIGGGPSTGRVRLVQSLALDPRRRVVLVECDGQSILVLTGGTTDLVLSARSNAYPVAQP